VAARNIWRAFTTPEAQQQIRIGGGQTPAAHPFSVSLPEALVLVERVSTV